jgi:tRNA pseudouridine32 synthase/23S rRNA pseudouridine746 synthase
MAMIDYTPPQDPVKIVEEDDFILVVDKPSGLLSVPGRDPKHYDSMWSRVLNLCPDAQVVHRLDMSTSGLMLFAKTKHAESALKKQFQYRLTHKVYFARVWGVIEQNEGTIDLPLICDWPNRPRQKVCFDSGKPSQTYFQVVAREEQTSVVRLFPITGRSHQLRVHLQALGHPIVGDEFYAPQDAIEWSDRLQLHSAELSFYHPKNHWLRRVFVPCEFYDKAEPIIYEHYDPERKLPDYKSLPRP